MTLSLNDLQTKFINKVSEKCAGGMTLPRLLRKQFMQVDLDNDGCVNIREWAQIVEGTNNAISPAEASALFEFWDSAGYTREPSGLVSSSDAISSLLTAELSSAAVFDQRAAPPPSRGNEAGNRGNRSSMEGGIFGGGVYESDARRASRPGMPAAQVEVQYQVPPDVLAAAQQRPRGNQSSVEGGIFGDAPMEASPRADMKKNSNQSSVPGGIFGGENAPPARAPVQQKRNSNQSSIPGGIFG